MADRWLILGSIDFTLYWARVASGSLRTVWAATFFPFYFHRFISFCIRSLSTRSKPWNSVLGCSFWSGRLHNRWEVWCSRFTYFLSCTRKTVNKFRWTWVQRSALKDKHTNTDYVVSSQLARGMPAANRLITSCITKKLKRIFKKRNRTFFPW